MTRSIPLSILRIITDMGIMTPIILITAVTMVDITVDITVDSATITTTRLTGRQNMLPEADTVNSTTAVFPTGPPMAIQAVSQAGPRAGKRMVWGMIRGTGPGQVPPALQLPAKTALQVRDPKPLMIPNGTVLLPDREQHVHAEK